MIRKRIVSLLIWIVSAFIFQACKQPGIPECPLGFKSFAGQCRKVCESRNDCLGSLVCDESAKVCVEGSGDMPMTGPVSVNLSENTVTVVESDDEYVVSLKLSDRPVGDVVLSITSSDEGAARVEPTTLTIPEGTYADLKQLRVIPVDDDDTRDEEVTITVSGEGVTTISFTVTITDPDVQSLVLAPNMRTITEGTTATVAVSLAFEPDEEITFNLVTDNSSVATAAPRSISINEQNWKTPQAVTITTYDDADLEDETANITVSGGTFSETIMLMVTDDDTQNILLSASNLSLEEDGANGTIGISLAQQPSSDVVVTLNSNDANTATVEPSTLTFTAENYATEQAISVTPVADENLVVNNTTIEVTSPNLTTQNITVEVVDTDAQSIIISDTSLTITEGQTATITAYLRYEPAAAVDITATASTAAIQISPSTLTFDATNFAAAQNIVVTANQDMNVADAISGLRLTSPGAANADIVVNVTDDDTLTIIANPTSVTVAESGTASFTVVLSHEPSQDVLVQLSSGNENIASPATDQVTFTSSNYSTPVTIDINGFDDDNDYDDTTTITASGGTAVTATVDVTVTDNDVQNIILNPGTVALQEDGTSGEFTVALAYAPANPIQVTVTSPDPDAVTVSPSTLTFDSSNYNTTQTVSATPVEDDDIGDEAVLIEASATGLPTRQVTVTVEDQDIQSIVFDPTTATVNEGGTLSVGVRLAYNNLSNVDVTLSSADTGAVEVSPTTLSFTDSNWSTVQTITLTGVQDADAGSETTNILAQASVSSIPDAQLGVSVIDDDEQRIVVATPSNLILNVTEGSSANIEVNMAFQPLPGQDITVNLTSSDNSAVQFSPSSLTFTSVNYQTPQPINVVAQHDVDFANKTITLKLSAAGQDDVDITTNITDDDTQDVVVSTNMISLDEGQAGQTFTIRLAYAPSNQVTVDLSSSDVGAVSVSPATLSFNANNYDQPQIVTVTPINDNDTIGELTTVSINHDTGAQTITKSVQVSVTDDDIQSLQFLGVINNRIALTEGQSTNLLVRLAFDPTTNLNVSVFPDASLSLSGSSLEFTGGNSGNWAVPQLLTVTANTDNNVTDSTGRLTFSIGTETIFLDVDVTDPDVQALSVTPNSLSFDEESSGTLSVSLAYSPAASQEVTLTANNTGAVSVNPTRVTFSASNYNTPVTVTVSGLEDDDLNDESVTIAVSSIDVTTVNVPVTVSDIDEQSIIVSQSSLTLTEDDTTTFTIRLAQEPNAETFVDLSSSDSNAASTSAQRLSFTAQNWSIPQTIIVNGVDDADTNNESVTLTISSGSLPTRSVSVSITDPDTQAIQLSSNALNVTEGLNNSFTVSLAYDPVAPVTLSVASADTAIATVSPSTINLDSGNYSSGVTVTVTGLQDQNVQNENVNVTVAAAVANTVTLPVTIVEDDTQSIVVSSNSISINENGNGTLGIALAYEPASNVTVNVRSADSGAVSVNGLENTAVTFTTSNYGTTQNVTLAGVTDADLEDESVIVTLSSANLADTAVTVSVTDDDVQSIQLSASTLTLSEGGASGNFGVQLTQQPSGTVVLNVSSADANAASVSPSTLTFDASNYTVAQSVTVSPADDNDTANESVSVTIGNASIANETVVVAVNDDDTQAIQVVDYTGTPISVSEGDSANIVIRLAFDPVNPTTVSVASSDSSIATVSPSTLTFTSANYQSGLTVAVNSQEDADLTDENINVTLSGASASDTTVAFQINDDDTQALVIAPTSLSITENGTGQVSVALAFQPSANVTITAASSDTAKVGFNGSVLLTFNDTNYAQPQTITLEGTDDSDTANESETITISDGNSLSETVSVNVTDDDALNLSVSAGSLTLTEGGQIQNFTVQLTAQPASATTVNVSSSDTNVANITQGASLSFTTSNWNQPQTVTVEAPDDTDTADNSATISVESAGLTTFSVNASVTDDDTQAITSDQASVTVSEGSSEVFNVRLAFNPLGSVTVNLSSSDPGAATVSPSTLVFTAANYDSTQPVTVSAVQDADLATESLSISLQSAVANANVNVSVTEDDTQSVVVTPSTVEVQENGSTTFTVSLAFIPPANEILNLSSADPNAATVANASGGTSLTFTPENYNQAQTVTVNGVNDLDTSNETVNLSIGSNTITSATVVTTVTDDDVLSLLVSETSLNMVSGGPTQQFTVALSAQPSANVTVNVASATTAIAQVNPGSITFTPSNYASPVSVTVTAPADDDAVDDTTDITVSSTGLTSQNISVSATDNDVQAIVVNNNSITLDEGSSNTFTVRMAYNPRGTISVNLASSNSGSASLSSSFLNFDASNWSTPQTVTVNGEDDADLTDESVDITLSTGGVVANVVVAATINDNDTQALQVSSNSLEINEGESTTFNVTLAYQPAGTVTVELNTADADAASISATSLTFNSGNYNQAQVITVGGVQDEDIANENVTISVSSAGLTTENINVVVTEDDTQSLVVSDSTLTVIEGGTSQTFSVSLAYRPASNVTVNVASSDTGAVSISSTALTFTPGTYNVPQVITVDGAQDNDTNDESVIISVSSTGLPSRTIDVNVTDNDTQAINVPNTLTVAEGSTNQITISLQWDPVTSQDVTISSSNEGAATVSQTTVTLTSANYQSGVTVTVNGIEDNDVTDEAVTLTLSSAIAPNENVSVSVTDNDTQSIQVSETTLEMTEGANDTFDVTLAFQPANTVQIAVSSSDSGAASPTPTLLTFEPADYNIAQTVTINGVTDDDVANESGAITVGDTGNSLPKVTLDYSVTDDDTQALVVTPGSLSLTEGAAQSIGIELAFRPASDVSVTLTSSDPNKVSAASTSLTFTSENYNTAQLVSISAVNDADLEDHNENITISAASLTDVVVNVDVTDDDEQQIELDSVSPSTTEGSSTNLGIRLAYQPSGTVNVSIASSDTDAASLGAASVSFNASNYNVYQTVALTGEQDNDTQDENVTITVSSTGLTNQLATLSVADDDTQDIIVSANSLTIGEGGSQTFTVSLAFNPVSDLNVGISTADPNLATATPNTLTFTEANYNAGIVVTVNAPEDVDVADDTVDLTVSAGSLPGNTETIAVTINDNDTQALVVSPTSLEITENSSENVSVSLAFQPSSDVSVSLTSADIAVATVDPNQASLTFTAANYNQVQTVAITAQDDQNTIENSTTVNVTSTGLTTVPVAITAPDDDVQNIVVSQTNLPLTEGGSASTFTVSLAFAPAATINLNVADSTNSGKITIAGGPGLTFTTTNWNTPQTITVSPTDDNDTANENVSITVSDLATTNALPSRTITVPVTDDDVQAIELDSTSLSLNEGGAQTVRARLAFDPLSATTVSVSSGDPDAASVSVASLSFNAGNYNVWQDVVITAEQDQDLADELLDITFSSAAAASDSSASVSVTDDDTQALVTTAPAATITEGANTTFTVALAYIPGANVSLDLAVSDDNKLTIAGPDIADPLVLTFTPANYSTPQTVTVTAQQDNDVSDETESVSVTGTGLTYNPSITVNDDDNQAITLTPTDLTGPEGATTQAFTVRLDYDPEGTVTLSLTSTDTSVATVESAGATTISFNSTNYSTPQTVSVVGIDDADLVDETVTIIVADSAAVISSAQLSFTVEDDDTQSIVAAPTTITVTEGTINTADTVDVNLAFQPAADTTVSLLTGSNVSAVRCPPGSQLFDGDFTGSTSFDDSINTSLLGSCSCDGNGTNPSNSTAADFPYCTDGTFLGQVLSTYSATGPFPCNLLGSNVCEQRAPTQIPWESVPSLTFTPANYNITQSFYVQASDDEDVADNETTITLTADSETVPSVLLSTNVTVTVTDDDTQGLVFGGTGGIQDIPEGSNGSFTVRLAYNPLVSQQVNLSVSDAGAISLSSTTLTFNASNWQTPQTINVTGLNDTDPIDEEVTITLTSAGIATREITATVDDVATNIAILSDNFPGLPGLPSIDAFSATRGALAVGEREAIKFVITGSNRSLVADVHTEAGRLCDMDTVLDLYDPNNTLVASNDDGGVHRCSSFDDLVRPSSAYNTVPRTLTQGTWHLVVRPYNTSSGTLPGYVINTSTFEPNICGNGFADGTEQCDDGNTISGDGCSSTCIFESNTVEGTSDNNSIPTAEGLAPWPTPTGGLISIVGGIAAQSGDEDWYTFTVPSSISGSVNFYASLERYRNFANSEITLTDVNGVELVTANDTNTYPDLGPILSAQNVTLPTLVPGNTYFIRVRGQGGISANYVNSYRLNVSVGSPRCGDGSLDSEQCDDGNTTDGDGCSSTCTIEPTGTHTGTTSTFTNNIENNWTTRTYQVDVVDDPNTAQTDGSYLNAKVFAPGASNTTSCTNNNESRDPFLVLMDAQGNTLTTDDNSGPSICPAFDSNEDDALKLTPGTYFVIVREDGQNAQIGRYDIEINTSPADTCGNGVIEIYSNNFVEQCDDGNTDNNDGCNSTCQIEDANIELEINGDTASAQVLMAESSALGAPCSSDQDCDSGICTALGQDSGWGHCTVACDPNNPCSSEYTCDALVGQSSNVCLLTATNGGPQTQAFTVVGSIEGESLVSASAAGFGTGSPFPGYMCGRTSQNNVWCWGSNGYGVLGDGTTNDNYSPQEVSGLSNVIQISAGYTHACAVVDAGQNTGQGTISCWGNNSQGQAGSTGGGTVLSPASINGSISNFTQVSAGFELSCALTSTGEVYCWGAGSYGQLGNNATSDTDTPVRVQNLPDIRQDPAVQVTAGVETACARTSRGSIYCWGNNNRGQMANGSSSGIQQTAIAIPNPSRVNSWTDVDINVYTICAVADDATVYCWGENDDGQAGTGTDPTTSPVRINTPAGSALSGISEVSAGFKHSCARSSSNVFCWGKNDNGELGNGTTNQSSTAVEVVNLSDPTQLTTSAEYSCAMRAAGGLVCWGSNDDGNFGTGAAGGNFQSPQDSVCRASGFDCETDKDYYAFDVPDGWHIRAIAKEGLAENCSSSQNLRIYLRNSSNSNLMTALPQVPTYCPAIDPGTFSANGNQPCTTSADCNSGEHCADYNSSSTNYCMYPSRSKGVTKGRYYLQLEESGQNAELSQYMLQVEIIPPNVCGNNVLDDGEQCDDGNTSNGDGCSSTCTVSSSDVHTHDPSGASTQSSSFSLTNNSRLTRSNVRVDLNSANLGEYYIAADVMVTNVSGSTSQCVDSKSYLSSTYTPSTIIKLYTFNGGTNTAITSAYWDTDRDVCTALNPSELGEASKVTSGSDYWLEVVEEGYDNYFSDYSLVVSTMPADVCGNGVVETYGNIIELCDDGNTASGDGCNSSCVWEVTQVVDGTANSADISQDISVTFNSLQDRKVIQLNVAGGQSISALAGVNVSSSTCELDTKLELMNSAYEIFLSDESHGTGSCAQIFNNGGASGVYWDYVSDDLPAGTYYFVVSAESGSTFPVTTNVNIGITATSCGNGVLEANAGEECDSGVPAGDPANGCSSTCQVSAPIVSETEPNDSRSNATPTGLSGVGNVIATGVTSEKAQDYFSFVSPSSGSAATLTARAQGNYNDANTCKGYTSLWVYNSSGAQLCNNYSSGWINCGYVTNCSIPADGDTYYIRTYTFGYDNPGLQSDYRYFLDISLAQ